MAIKKADGLGVMIQLVSKLPWWSGVSLGVASYLFLHELASGPIAVAAISEQVATAVMTAMSFLQYLIPLGCGTGAVMSAWNRSGQRKLREDATNPSCKGTF